MTLSYNAAGDVASSQASFNGYSQSAQFGYDGNDASILSTTYRPFGREVQLVAGGATYAWQQASTHPSGRRGPRSAENRGQNDG